MTLERQKQKTQCISAAEKTQKQAHKGQLTLKGVYKICVGQFFKNSDTLRHSANNPDISP